MNSFFKERYHCDKCYKQFHYKTDLHSHQKSNCDALGKIPLILDEMSIIGTTKFKKAEIFSCCDEEMDQSSLQLRNTSTDSKKNNNNLNDTMMDTENHFNRNTRSNFVFNRTSNCNDTMIDNHPNQKRIRTFPNKRKEPDNTKLHDSFNEYFYDNDESNSIINSDIDEFYFESSEGNQTKTIKKATEKAEGDSLKKYDEFFVNP